MQTMYESHPGSPELTLASDITDTDTVIPLNEDVSQLPSAPNIATIYNKVNGNWETVLYESVDTANNWLETVTRGFEGTAQSWSSGTSVARLIAAHDLNALKTNVNELDVVIDTVDPTSDEDSYRVGKFWLNTSDNGVFICFDNTSGSAIWKELQTV